MMERETTSLLALTLIVTAGVGRCAWQNEQISSQSRIKYWHDLNAQREKKIDNMRQENKLENEAAVAWKEDHDSEKAKSLLLEAIAQFRRADRAELMIAQILDEQGRDKEAYGYYRTIVGNPLTGTIRSPAVMLRYGELSGRLGYSNEAVHAYADAIQTLNTEHHDNHYIKLVPGNQNLGYLHALAQLAVGAQQRDLKLLSEAVNAEPRLAIGHLYFGLTLQKVHHKSEATSELQKASATGNAEIRESANEALQLIR